MNGNSRKKISLARKIARTAPWIPKATIAKTLGVARSSFYVEAKQPEKDKEFLDRVLDVLREHPYYGHRRIALVLCSGKNTVLRVMRKYGLTIKQRKKCFRKPPKLPQSPIPNRTARLSPIGPNVFWAGDFTLLKFHALTIYLVTVIDCYTREIVGYATGLHHSAQLVVDALEDAQRKRVATPSVFHSDQGSEYQSLLLKGWLLAHRILPSHSKKSSPWQNGMQESFYRTLKQEVGNLNDLALLDELYEALAKYIHYYNTKRLHGALKKTPEACFTEWREQENARQSVIHSV